MKQIESDRALELFSINAKCTNDNKAKRLCTSGSCSKADSIYLCDNRKQQCLCQYAHKNCPTISLQSLHKKLMNYEMYLKDFEIHQYLLKFEKIYTHLENKIKKQKQRFKKFVQKNLFDESLYSIKHKIVSKKINQINSNEVKYFINSFDNEKLKRFSHVKMTLRQAKQLDEKIQNLVSSIQKLYSGKFKIANSSIDKNPSVQKLRPYSSSVLSKQSTIMLNSRNSSAFHCDSVKMPTNTPLILNNTKSIIFGQMNNFDKYPLNFSSHFSLLQPYPKNLNSKIIKNDSIIGSQFIMKKIKQYELIYRASDHNFSIKNFYENYIKLIDNEKIEKDKSLKNNSLLILIKTQFNHILGAFTQCNLNSKNHLLHNKQHETDLNKSQFSDNEQNPQSQPKAKQKKLISDFGSSTFIFSLNLRQKYFLKDPYKAIYVSNKSLGFGNKDLRIRNKANELRQNYCRIGGSFSIKRQNQCQFAIDYKEKNQNIIGSKHGTKFKIKQWEAFKVVYQHTNETKKIKNKKQNTQLIL